ncbi:ATP-binding protein [Cupriavidus sp. 30B13]|uniref:ATP-binding protein n=1 Tax=Cupriavidus sp. 30B13 TaxID=3384241 RepID=UPI003B8FAD3E
MEQKTAIDVAGASSAEVFAFGPFRLIPGRQLLLKGETTVRIGGRALEILAALAERPGEIVSKAELMRRAWPNTVVEESNLKVHMTALRRALGDGQPGQRFIATIIGRGYRFVAPVAWASFPTHPLAAAQAQHNLPASTTRLIGRADALDALRELLHTRRIVTVMGPGGIGKTSVALAVAEAVAASGEHEVRFVDLAPLPDGEFAASAIASALGLMIQSGDPVAVLTAYLRDRSILIVLDSCEHVTDAAAMLVEQIVSGAPGVSILATSRESLRVRGESVYRLPPLQLAPESPELTAAEAQSYPAVRLFVERAAECLDGFELADADAPGVAAICRKLDGIALAIELTATRVDAFGIHELSLLLNDRLRLLSQDRRGMLPRHRTLAATLDWSYDYLPAHEQVLLRRLSVFTGPFTRESALAMSCVSGADEANIVEAIASLIAKSLLVADLSGNVVHYRLLDTTRAYGQQKLLAHGELDRLTRLHATHHRNLLTRAAAEWEARPTVAWLADYGSKIDDVRGALRWAFSPAGDREIGLSLTVAAIPLWMHLSLFDECRQCVERALAAVLPAARDGGRDEMKLNTALGAALLYAQGPTQQTGKIWKRALLLAEQIGDGEHRLRALWGLLVYHTYKGEHRAALHVAERFRQAANELGDRAASLSVDRMSATSLRYLGDQAKARQYLDRMLDQYVSPEHRSHVARFHLDQRAAALGTLAHVLWLQGYPDQALAAAQHALDDAQATNHRLSLSNALVHTTCSIALQVGDLEAARHALTVLQQHLARHPVTFWNALCGALDGMLRLALGDFTGISVLRGALDALRETGFRLRYPAYLGALAEGMGAAGRLSDAHATIDEALAWSSRNDERWCFPELLRIKGELLRLGETNSGLEAAAHHFRQAINVARHQQALAWELRAATSLARLPQASAAPTEALDLLVAVHARFTEGHGTSDLVAARTLIEQRRRVET